MNSFLSLEFTWITQGLLTAFKFLFLLFFYYMQVLGGVQSSKETEQQNFAFSKSNVFNAYLTDSIHTLLKWTLGLYFPIEKDEAASFKSMLERGKTLTWFQKSAMRKLTWFLICIHTYKIKLKILRQDVNLPHKPTGDSLPKSRHRV